MIADIASGNTATADVLFLIAAIVFVVAAIVSWAEVPPRISRFGIILTNLALALVALGFLAL